MSRRHALQPSDLEPQQPAGEGDGADLLTQVQVCRKLGISDETWRRWRRALRTPLAVTMPSGRLKWRASEIAGLEGYVRDERAAGRRYFGSVRNHAPTIRLSSRPRNGQMVAVKRVAR